MRNRHPELLIPASSLEVLKTAVMFGADAVYIGGEAFGLRAKAKNFSMEDMKEGIAFAHAHGVKVYVTANILAHNRDLEGVRAYFEELKEQMQKQYEYHQSILSDEQKRPSLTIDKLVIWSLYTRIYKGKTTGCS